MREKRNQNKQRCGGRWIDRQVDRQIDYIDRYIDTEIDRQIRRRKSEGRVGEEG